MVPLNRLIADGLKALHLENGVKEKQSVPLWERVAGESVAAVTHADGIRDGILWVHTKSSAWSQELSLLREPLIWRINAELGHEAVKDIRFQVRRMDARAEVEEHEADPPRELTDTEKNAITHLSERLDESVARRIAAVAERQMRGTEAGRVCAGCGGPVRGNTTRCPFCR